MDPILPGAKLLATKVKGDDVWNLYEHLSGHPAAYHRIVKISSKGNSTQNVFGGYESKHVGVPRYIASKWKKI